MDLYHHDQPLFTRWIVENRLLNEPFVVIDVGVQGGEHPRWDFLGDQVRVYGFDAIAEAVERIGQGGGRPHRHYRALALGNEDGEREFYVPMNTFSASFYRGPSLTAGAQQGAGAAGPRTVPIRRLDTLFAAGEVPLADYVKIDCEGFEHEVLAGARNYLARSNVLCVTAETSFAISNVFPRTQFTAINDLVLEHRLLLFDISYVRYSRPAYLAAKAKHPWPPADMMHDSPDLDVGQPGTVDAVFCRNLVQENRHPELYPARPDAVTAPTVDKIVKSMINFELHGLMDCAAELADHFRAQLSERLDVEKALALLARRPNNPRNTADMVECLRMVAALRTRVLAQEREIGAGAVQPMALDGAPPDVQELHALYQRRLSSQQAAFDSKLTSVRFLSAMLRRELGKRLRKRLGRDR